jgi:hypothetical protein
MSDYMRTSEPWVPLPPDELPKWCDLIYDDEDDTDDEEDEAA